MIRRPMLPGSTTTGRAADAARPADHVAMPAYGWPMPDFLATTRDGYDRAAAHYVARFQSHLDGRPVDRASEGSLVTTPTRQPVKRSFSVLPSAP